MCYAHCVKTLNDKCQRGNSTLNGPYLSVSYTKKAEDLFYSEVLISRSEGIRTKHVVEKRLLIKVKNSPVRPSILGERYKKI